MKKTITVPIKEPGVVLAGEIVYGHRWAWGNIAYRPLKLSLMRPRAVPGVPQKLPLIVWLCGGGFTEVDRTVWLPELVWFAKQGYAVASVDYSTTYRTVFPEQAEDVKLAIRFLKAHSADYGLDPDRIVLMGESAGGYLTTLCGLTGTRGEFDRGGFESYTSQVQAAIPWYPPVRLSEMAVESSLVILPHDIAGFTDLTTYVTPEAPPFLILHGSGDSLVPCAQGELLYDALHNAGADAELVLLEGAEHADTAFLQREVKEIILDFIRGRL
jgi:acetyl esterase/lipase